MIVKYSRSHYSITLGIVACLLLILGGLDVCNGQGVKSKSKEWNKSIEIIVDQNFEDGIGLQGTNSAHPDILDTLLPFGKEKDKGPYWKLAQWGCKYSLQGAEPQEQSNGSVTYADASKSINFWHTDSTTEVSMKVFASKEFDGPRKDGESWPNILLQQKFNHKVFIGNASKLKLDIDVRLMFTKMIMKQADFNKKLHTAQYTLYFTIQDLNQNSKGYGDYLWFGLTIYDYRFKKIPTTGERDKGKSDATRKFIYKVGSKYLYKGSTQDEQWKQIRVDIYPFIKKAFKKAKNRGYLEYSNFDDMALTGMNIGWEMPGTYDAGLQFKGLSLTAFPKE